MPAEGASPRAGTQGRKFTRSRWVPDSRWSGFRDDSLRERAHVDEVAGDGGGGGHLRRDQVRAPAVALPALEVAVRGGGAALAGLELVGVHAEAHGAAGLA